MNITQRIKQEWLQVLILIVPFVFIPFVWSSLPDQIPIHWNYNGHPNGYAGKAFGLFFIPLLNIALAALFIGLSKIDPKAWMMNVSSEMMKPMRLVITSFMTVIFIVTTLAILYPSINITEAFQYGIPVLFLLLGNFLPTVKPNYFVGVRTPWTLHDPDNWRMTHRLAGRLWVVASVIYLVLEVVLGGQVPQPMFWTYLGIIALVPIVYSFVLFQRSKGQTA